MGSYLNWWWVNFDYLFCPKSGVACHKDSLDLDRMDFRFTYKMGLNQDLHHPITYFTTISYSLTMPFPNSTYCLYY